MSINVNPSVSSGQAATRPGTAISSGLPADGFAPGLNDVQAQQQTALKQLRGQRTELDTRLDEVLSAAKTSPNPVVASLESTVRQSQDVKIDLDQIKKCAANLKPEQLKPANWKFPQFIDEDSKRTIDFFFLLNSINFMFFDPSNGDKFHANIDGTDQAGSQAMIGSLKQALKEGKPILDADYLSNITEDQMKGIFRGNREIPMLKERTEIFHEVGKTLKDKYGGSFANLAEQAHFKAFDNGNGMVERLARDFPSFNDVSPRPDGPPDVFLKRAQLAVSMTTNRLAGTDLFPCKDADKLTVFADYELPRGLRSMGILKYSDALANEIDNGKPLPKDSRQEQELRANTIMASELLLQELKKRPDMQNANAMGIDSLIWAQARHDTVSKAHITVTTAY